MLRRPCRQARRWLAVVVPHRELQMKPQWIVYSASPPMSAGLQALRRQLRARGSEASADVLGPITALRELEAVCSSVTAGRGKPNPENRTSLLKDVIASLEALGDTVSGVLAPQLPDFRGQVGGLMKALDSVAATRSIQLGVESLLSELSSAAAPVAAWRDAVAAFLDVNGTSSRCERRIQQLVEIAEHRGVDYDAWARRADSILGDDARVMAQFDVYVADDYVRNDGIPLAGLNEDRRLELCEQTLGGLPARSTAVVWLALADAVLPAPCIDAGGIALFESGLMPDGILSGEARTESGAVYPPPPELQDDGFVSVIRESLAGLDGPPDSRALVRTTFEQTTVAEARSRAREVVRGIIDIGEAGSTWRLLDGELIWTPEHWSGRGFTDPERQPKTRFRRAIDPASTRLQELSPGFVRRWLDGDADAERAADVAVWVATLKRTQSHEQRVISAVRAVEQVLARVQVGTNGSWVDSARRYLQSTMINHVLLNEIQDALFCAYNVTERAVERPEELFERLKMMTSPGKDTGYTWSALTQDLAVVLPQALDLADEGSMPQRILREAARVLADPAAMLERLGQIELWFDRMLDRTARQRNALVHSTATAEAVLRNVDSFVVLLASYVSDEGLRSDVAAAEPLAAFERDRVNYLKRTSRLEAGAVPADHLWD